MNKEEYFVGQFFSLRGLGTYYGVITKINKKSLVIQYNLNGRVLVNKETLLSKKYFWMTCSPIKSDNIEVQKIALHYCTFGNHKYKYTESDYIYNLQMKHKGIFDKLM